MNELYINVWIEICYQVQGWRLWLVHEISVNITVGVVHPIYPGGISMRPSLFHHLAPILPRPLQTRSRSYPHLVWRLALIIRIRCQCHVIHLQ